jgi:hypothetical protein
MVDRLDPILGEGRGYSVAMLSIDDEITLVEVLVILLGIGVTWAIYHRSDQAELPGEATEPDPSVPDDPFTPKGRTIE